MEKEIQLKSPESLSINEIITLIFIKILNKFRKGNKYNWTVDAVFDASTIPELIYRTYLETKDVRTYLDLITQGSKIKRIADIGCGFGRWLPLLSEYSEEVIGFEREDNLIKIANQLYPNLPIIKIDDLANIPYNNAFDLVFVFTVLQHLTDNKVQKLSKEISRLTKQNGFLLICEQTDSSDQFGDINDETKLIQRGRDIEEYKNIFNDFTLIKSSKRINEPTYRRTDIGSYMLFKKL
jgi:SAM-dependent methyltransferase